MQCVLNRLLYVIFDKLPHINANFDFLPEPGGTENISIKQIMLEEKTSSIGMLHREGGCFCVCVWYVFSVWPFRVQNERNILRNMWWSFMFDVKEDFETILKEGVDFTYSEKRDWKKIFFLLSWLFGSSTPHFSYLSE